MGREHKQADEAAKLRLAATPHAVAVVPSRDGRMLIEMSNGIGLLVDVRRVEGLEAATAADLAQVEISPSGFGLHFPTLDADVYLPGLLQGRFGSARYLATASDGTPPSASASKVRPPPHRRKLSTSSRA